MYLFSLFLSILCFIYIHIFYSLFFFPFLFFHFILLDFFFDFFFLVDLKYSILVSKPHFFPFWTLSIYLICSI
ncbi:hypothetical protein F4703DRAFT_1822378 [Phycomyces blakesleeanus]